MSQSVTKCHKVSQSSLNTHLEMVVVVCYVCGFFKRKSARNRARQGLDKLGRSHESSDTTGSGSDSYW